MARAVDRTVRRAGLGAGFLAWALLCLWCARGTPPGVDLPAHAAQMQTLASLLGGEAEVSGRLEARFVPGYGWVTWSALYVYGKGPLPPDEGPWCVARSAFQWRRHQHQCAPARP
jgi:hypothetical protein